MPSRPAAALPAQRNGLGFIAQNPRASAAAVIGVLGFGALVGSLAGGASASDPGAIVVLNRPAVSSTPPDSPATLSGPATRTVTDAAPAPAPAPAPPAPAPATTTPTTDQPAPPALPPIKHVFLIVLSNQGYTQSFGDSAANPYLAKTLAGKGELISNYYAVAGGSLANEIALISGQGPTNQTLANCPQYQEIQPATIDETGQVSGDGCGYPEGVITIGDQLKSAKLTYKVYLDTKDTAADRQADGTADPPADTTADPQVERCRPQPGSAPGAPGQPYAAWRNPFLYFAGTSKDACPKQNVPLAQLDKDLSAKAHTPSLSYIVPDLCDGGGDPPCDPSAPSGVRSADAFLQSVVPKIEKSPAYRAGGMIAITFDQAPQTGDKADSTSCCGQPTYPNLAGSSAPSDGSTTSTDTTPTDTTSTPTTTTTTETTPPTTGDTSTPSGDPTAGQAKGGGVVGLLLISKYVKPGTINGFDLYNHFSLMASIEDLFGLDRIGYAAATGLPVFGDSVYTAYSH